MGIVMALAMLLGLVASTGKRFLGRLQPRIVAAVLIISGLWNILWYGVAHASEFWGQAAIISGLAMLLMAWFLSNQSKLKLFGWSALRVVQILLLICFLLYLTTLIQLNLGMDIIT